MGVFKPLELNENGFVSSLYSPGTLRNLHSISYVNIVSKSLCI